MFDSHIAKRVTGAQNKQEVDLASEIARTQMISNKLAQAMLLEVEAKELAEQANKIIEQEMPN